MRSLFYIIKTPMMRIQQWEGLFGYANDHIRRTSNGAFSGLVDTSSIDRL